MSTVPATDEIGEVGELSEDVIRSAERTVAANAHDKADLKMLLNMLGLGVKPKCTECGGPMTSPDGIGKQHTGAGGVCWRCRLRVTDEPCPPVQQVICGCGKKAVPGGTQCKRCRDTVPADLFRRVYDRIREETGRCHAQIARGAGLNRETISTIVVPSSTRERVTRGLYQQLVDAYKDEVDLA